MKVCYIDNQSSLDKVRGIGVNTTNLKSAISRYVEIVEDQNQADIVHITKFNLFKVSLPFLGFKKPTVLTIHDLIPLIYPKHYPPGLKGKVNFLINKFLIQRYVNGILTISETSKKDICRFLNIDPAKVKVAYLGYNKAFRQKYQDDQIEKIVKSYNLNKNYVVYMGDVNYNKNLGVLYKACQKAKIDLVIIGKHASEVEKMDLSHPEHRHLKNIDFSRTKRLGYISDEDAAAVINKSICLVQPSFYEGFGLSVIHGFAAGTPVVSSKVQALVEIASQAAVYFDPDDVDGLVKRIKGFKNNPDLRSEYIEKGFERLKIFNWDEMAKQVYSLYKSLI